MEFLQFLEIESGFLLSKHPLMDIKIVNDKKNISSLSFMPEIIQLNIWDKLTIATNNSIGADFLGLLTEVDE